jgi:hypothetical protein
MRARLRKKAAVTGFVFRALCGQSETKLKARAQNPEERPTV